MNKIENRKEHRGEVEFKVGEEWVVGARTVDCERKTRPCAALVRQAPQRPTGWICSTRFVNQPAAARCRRKVLRVYPRAEGARDPRDHRLVSFGDLTSVVTTSPPTANETAPQRLG